VNHGLAIAAKALASREVGNAPLCLCGAPSALPGTLCAHCVATHPAMPVALQVASLASAIREAERALEQTLRSANHQAAALSDMRRLYDQLAIAERSK
jgi:hypothetical protein